MGPPSEPTESSPTRARFARTRLASMGPSAEADGEVGDVEQSHERLDTRFNGAVGGSRRRAAFNRVRRTRPRACFNGAAVGGRRKESYKRAEVRPGEASMGPSAVADGERSRRAGRARGHAASMGPSAVADGKARPRPDCRGLELASMGPSAVADGERAAGLQIALEVFALQWGGRR